MYNILRGLSFCVYCHANILFSTIRKRNFSKTKGESYEESKLSHIAPPPQSAHFDILRFFAGAVLCAFLASSVIAETYTYDGAAWSPSTPSTITGENTFEIKNDVTISSTISGDGSFTKTGAGTLILSATNSGYSGAVTISEGTLKLTKAGTSSSYSYGTLDTISNITVNEGATLCIAATHALGGSNNSSGVYGTLTLNGGTLNYESNSTSVYAAIVQPITMQNGGKITGSVNTSGGSTSTRGAFSFKSSITASGTGNEISVDAFTFYKDGKNTGDAKPGTIIVEEGGDLTISSNIFHSTNNTADYRAYLVKQGTGTLIFSDNEAGNSTKKLQTLDVQAGTMKFVGVDATVNVANTLKTAEGSKLNFVSNFSQNDDGTLTPDFSKVNVTNTATIEGTVTAGLADASMIASLASLSGTGTLLTAGSLSVEETQLTDNAIFNLSKDGNSIVATFNTEGKSDTLQINGSITTLTVGSDDSQLGWIDFANANENETYELQLEFVDSSQTGNWDDLVTYYKDLFSDYETSSNAENQTFTLFGLSLDENSAFLWDLTNNNATSLYSLASITTLNNNEIPEPATWALLILGAAALVFTRRKR